MKEKHESRRAGKREQKRATGRTAPQAFVKPRTVGRKPRDGRGFEASGGGPLREQVHVQWFPGHMAKTRRMIAANLKLVDIVAELRDARIPRASANPELERLLGGKKRIILLNKSDMADPAVTARWTERYRARGVLCLAVDCRSGKGLSGFAPAAREVLAPELARWQARGMAGRPLRVMVVGVPNAGKSSFINRMAASRRAKVEDRPGVTRGKQWVKTAGGLELLDTPGVLWPKFGDRTVGEHLAFTGAVKDDVVDIEALACRLLERLARDYPAPLAARYKLDAAAFPGEPGHALLAGLAVARGMLLPGGEVDTGRAAITLLDEFRAGVIGRISLEEPD